MYFHFSRMRLVRNYVFDHRVFTDNRHLLVKVDRLQTQTQKHRNTKYCQSKKLSSSHWTMMKSYTYVIEIASYERSERTVRKKQRDTRQAVESECRYTIVATFLDRPLRKRFKRAVGDVSTTSGLVACYTIFQLQTKQKLLDHIYLTKIQIFRTVKVFFLREIRHVIFLIHLTFITRVHATAPNLGSLT